MSHRRSPFLAQAYAVKEETMNTGNSSQELSTKLTAHIAELAQTTDAARMSDAMLAYLEMCARFHSYSPQNLWLILMVRPAAKHVAGYKRWRSMGRYVLKGACGIPILAPVIVKVDEDGAKDRKSVG